MAATASSALVVRPGQPTERAVFVTLYAPAGAVAGMSAADPGVDVLAALRGAQVADGDRTYECDALFLAQALDLGVADRGDDEVRPLGGRDGQRRPPVAGQRAYLVRARRTGDQEILAFALEPDRQHVWVAVEADEAELADDRPAQELVRPGVQCAVILEAVTFWP